MLHHIAADGMVYRLRPVTVADALIIVKIRLADKERNRYVHTISSDITDQISWIETYNSREGDYYFVIENKFTGKPEGLVGVYNIRDGCGEWGRWVLLPGSLAATESVDLIYRVAFEILGLKSVYCRTMSENLSVLQFHDGIGEIRRELIKDYVQINGKSQDAVEHHADIHQYETVISLVLKKKASVIFQRTMRQLIGKFEFHHIGVAVKDLYMERNLFQMIGYTQESPVFEDSLQGIKGMFLTATGQPRLELLQNLEQSTTLTKFLLAGIKMYHFAYLVNDFDQAVAVFQKMRAKMIFSPQISVYFGKRICFLMLPNMLLIELIEE